MAVSNRYTTGQSSIASYNFTDIDEGIGYVTYYGAEGTDEVVVLKKAIYSNEINQIVAVAGVGGAATKQLDVDYDLVFNTPKIVDGKLLVSGSLGVKIDGSFSNTIYWIVKVRKWDGSTETDLAENQSDDVLVTGGGGFNSEIVLLEVDVPSTNFGSGDTLRITLEGWVTATNTSVGNAGWGQDPKGRLGSLADTQIIEDTDTTILQFHVPFKIDA